MKTSSYYYSILFISLCTLLITQISSSATLPEPPAGLPSTFTASYSIKINDFEVGTSRVGLAAKDPTTYVYEALTETTGIAAWIFKDQVLERSEWVYHEDHLRPLKYIYKKTGGKKTRITTLDFDWQTNTIINAVEQRPTELPLAEKIQDKNLYKLSLMRDLALGRKKLEYVVADEDRLKTYTFIIVGEETLETAIGRVATVKLQRVNDVRGSTLWCAPALNYLPVLLTQTEKDGNKITMLIKRVSGFSAP